MNTLISIPFHHKPLCLIDADGKPYVAMRPIVDGMGIDWKTQERKLKSRFASTVVIMPTVALDGKQREMLCLPLEKLPAWLLTINPRKVNPAIRANVAIKQKAKPPYGATGQHCQARRNPPRNGRARSPRSRIIPAGQPSREKPIHPQAGKTAQRACPSRLTARTALCMGERMNTLALVALLLFTLTAMRR